MRFLSQGILLAHASVADCAVIGHAPTVAEEEKVIAYVVKKDDALTAEQVMAHVAAHVAVYKQVRCACESDRWVTFE